MIDFGQHLKKIRKDKGLTQKQLAELADSRERTIQQYEANDRKPSFDALIALANSLNVSIDYLVGRTDNPKRY